MTINATQVEAFIFRVFASCCLRSFAPGMHVHKIKTVLQ